ncbi:MAG: glycosyltransferase [Acidobacteria bacterium]|nr:glycosyltransferase [Acidobacteriota bacterium]
MTPGIVADIVVPVYNEGANIRRVLDSFRDALEYPVRVLICYDHDDDDTLPAVRGYDAPFEIVLVRNEGEGAIGAVLTGFGRTTAPAVVPWPADDDFNARRLNALIRKFLDGYDVVAASRFMPGGSMDGCPAVKAVLVRATAFLMWHLARVPTRDATSGLRLFSRRVIDRIPVESKVGFAYSIELLAKAHRLGWPIAEVPFLWRERIAGSSRFRVFAWAPQYLRWVGYAMATSLLRRGPETVVLRREPLGARP